MHGLWGRPRILATGSRRSYSPPMSFRRLVPFAVLLLVAGSIAVFAASPETASAAPVPQQLHFEYGPVHLNPGQNIIQYSSPNIPKPTVPGWITGIRANMVFPDGTVPPSDVIMLHHAVWLDLSAQDLTSPSTAERFFATGEEKSSLTLPTGFGYRYEPTDQWLLNYMLHVLVNQSFDVKLTYDLDFVPATSGRLRSVRPIWMDVQNGSSYPVFDAVAGTGVAGKYTYPAMANNPYGAGQKLNEYTVPAGGVIVKATGHLHSGGISTELYASRTVATGIKTKRVFKSDAVYWNPTGPVSWDMSMTATPATWKLHVKAGDVLSLQATYDTSSRSWYESMGIMMAWYAPGVGGKPTFGLGVDVPGLVTHGHLSPENDNHGGGVDPGLPDPAGLPNGPLTSTVNITGFEYGPTDLDLLAQVPTVPHGSSITFKNLDAPASGYGTFHTITGCKLPCNKSTGLSFPLPDGPVVFDSGQLGNDGPPTKGAVTWSTPSNLAAGDYTFYCRVHPFMRGVFRVTPS